MLNVHFMPEPNLSTTTKCKILQITEFILGMFDCNSGGGGDDGFQINQTNAWPIKSVSLSNCPSVSMSYLNLTKLNTALSDLFGLFEVYVLRISVGDRFGEIFWGYCLLSVCSLWYFSRLSALHRS